MNSDLDSLVCAVCYHSNAPFAHEMLNAAIDALSMSRMYRFLVNMMLWPPPPLTSAAVSTDSQSIASDSAIYYSLLAVFSFDLFRFQCVSASAVAYIGILWPKNYAAIPAAYLAIVL